MMSQWQTMFILSLFLAWSSDVGSQSMADGTTNNAVDLMFMVDSSYYINVSNFRTVLKSVVSFIETLPLGPSEVHVAAMSYSVLVDRSDFTWDVNSLSLIVPNLFYDGQAALTHVAFDQVYTVMTSRRSLRPNARKIVIIVTESFALYPAQSRQSAEKLLNSGVEVYAVGIGSYIRQLELLGYTGSLDRAILWDRYDSLPPIPLGLSSSSLVLLTEVVSSTDVATPTPRIQPSTASSFLPTLEETSTSTTTASPDTTATEFMISASAAISTSVTLAETADMSTVPTYSTYISVAPTATASESQFSTYISLAPASTPSDLRVSSLLVTEVSSTSTAVGDELEYSSLGFSSSVEDDFTISTLATASTPVVLATSASLYIIPTYIFDGSMTPSATANEATVPTYSSDTILALTTADSTYNTYTSFVPTPTQSSLLVSSTAAVDYPRNNTNTGDGSTVFDSVDMDGLCYKAVASKGFGFVPHPRDCDKFLQCHRSESGAVTASVRLCPRGQFWKQANLTCVSPDQTCCQDPCEQKCDGQTFRMDGGCGHYWECSKGVSMARKCPLFHAYIPGKGCVFMPTCVDADKSAASCQLSGKCESQPLRNNSGYRIQTISGPADFTCWASTEFDLASCSCRPLKRLSSCCPLVTLLDVASDVVTNTSLVNNAMARAGCIAPQISDNQSTGSTTNCSTGMSASSDPMRDVTVRFQYLTSTSTKGNELPQVLVRSSACVPERGGILVVSEDTSSLDVRIISSTGYVLIASLPLWALNKTVWWDVHIQYNRGDLFVELTAGNLVYNVYSKGGPHIPIGACGWKVGLPEELSDHLAKLTANITEVLVSRCDEFGF